MYNIEINPINLGYCCIFDAFGQTWYADIYNTYYNGYSECIIFPYSKEEKQVIDWGGVYCETQIPVSKEQLISCIEEFKRIGPQEWDNPQSLDIPDDMEEEYPDNIEDAQQQSEEKLPW